MAGMHEILDVRSLGEREPQRLTRIDLSDIIEPRMEEILQMVLQEIKQSGYAESAKLGWSSRWHGVLPGIVELAEDVFRLPARCGVPTGIGGVVELVNSPMYATGVGLFTVCPETASYGRFKITDDISLARFIIACGIVWRVPGMKGGTAWKRTGFNSWTEESPLSEARIKVIGVGGAVVMR